ILVRKSVGAKIKKVFEWDDEPPMVPQTFLIAPELIQPRSALKGPLDTLKDIA
ncbi:LacI family transcriptional regulator, partial [Mesorhizobium sp. M6A.T.Cr.TU.017.01.1.1]